MQSFLKFLPALVDPQLMPTAMKVAAIVGSLLFTINHGTALVQRQMTAQRWVSGILTYLIPYSVNIHGQYVSKQKRE